VNDGSGYGKLIFGSGTKINVNASEYTEYLFFSVITTVANFT